MLLLGDRYSEPCSELKNGMVFANIVTVLDWKIQLLYIDLFLSISVYKCIHEKFSCHKVANTILFIVYLKLMLNQRWSILWRQPSTPLLRGRRACCLNLARFERDFAFLLNEIKKRFSFAEQFMFRHSKEKPFKFYAPFYCCKIVE